MGRARRSAQTGQWIASRESSAGRREPAETFRAAAKGHEVNGDMERAAELRQCARAAEFRDGWRGVRRKCGDQ